MNCDVVGMKMQKCLDDKPFTEAKLKRNYRVVTLVSLQKSITINKDKIYEDPSILFSRLLFLVTRTGEPSSYFGRGVRHYQKSRTPFSEIPRNP